MLSELIAKVGGTKKFVALLGFGTAVITATGIALALAKRPVIQPPPGGGPGEITISLQVGEGPFQEGKDISFFGIMLEGGEPIAVGTAIVPYVNGLPAAVDSPVLTEDTGAFGFKLRFPVDAPDNTIYKIKAGDSVEANSNFSPEIELMVAGAPALSYVDTVKQQPGGFYLQPTPEVLLGERGLLAPIAGLKDIDLIIGNLDKDTGGEKVDFRYVADNNDSEATLERLYGKAYRHFGVRADLVEDLMVVDRYYYKASVRANNDVMRTATLHTVPGKHYQIMVYVDDFEKGEVQKIRTTSFTALDG